MTLKVKKHKIGDAIYQVRQHPAVEGCHLLETYHNAINAFCSIIREPGFITKNKHIIPFAIAFDKRWLGLMMFMDKIDAPTTSLSAWKKEKPNLNPHRLTVKEIKEGKTLADRAEIVDDTAMPFSVATEYKATHKQEQDSESGDVLASFLRYVTLDGEDVDIDSLSYADISELLAFVLVFNFLHIWGKPRFSLPENYSTGHDSPASVTKARASYSQPNVIYTILQSKLNLASYADLATILSTEDAFEMNESALIAYYEEAEAQKEAERQAKNNSKG